MSPFPIRPLSSNSSISISQLRWAWLIAGLTLGVMILEFATPSAYIFGYLYTGSILLTSARLPQRWVMPITFLAILLTLINLWIPSGNDIGPSTLANRGIAVLALWVTGYLSKRNREFQEAIAYQQVLLETNQQLASLREDFASTLTHDLKTPLLGAISTLTAFQAERFGAIDRNQHEVITTMIRSHNNSLQLLETLLDIYRNDTEGLRLTLAPIDLVTLIEQTTSSLFTLATNRQVYLSLNYGPSDFRHSLWVQGDTLQLERVLGNLLVNSINHSRRGERIEIVLESQEAYHVVKFLDTGAGIMPDEFPRLFERFYQGQGARQAKGTGLGLYLSRQIIEAHGGKIWAENRHPAGAIFCFKLPVAANPQSFSHVTANSLN
jgi:two-component system NarL family sensor kinase